MYKINLKLFNVKHSNVFMQFRLYKPQKQIIQIGTQVWPNVLLYYKFKLTFIMMEAITKH